MRSSLRFKLGCIVCLALLPAAAVASLVSMSYGVSESGALDPGFPSELVEFAFDDNLDGWAVEMPGGGDIPISFDPGFGPWVKELVSSPSVMGNTTYVVRESLVVGDGPAWFDWHEEIRTPGWVWTSGTISLSSSAGSVAGTLSPDSATIWFNFAAAPPGTMIVITKFVQYVGAMTPIPSIMIAQFPTVPLPASVWLLGSALLAFVWRRRRR